MEIWLTIHSAAILLLAGVLYLAIRQIGVLLNRVGPVGARQAESESGPRVGENVGFYLRTLRVGFLPTDAPVLYLFASESCAICSLVRDAAILLGKLWSDRVGICLIYDWTGSGTLWPAEQLGDGVWMTFHPDLRHKLEIPLVPYGVLVDREGTVLGHGLVNATSHVESLLELTLDPDASKTKKTEAPGGRVPSSIASQPSQTHI